MTFFFTLFFVLMVFWRPQEWLATGLYGWPILDAVVGLAVLGFLSEVNFKRVRVPREMPQVWLLVGLWFAAIMSHVAHTYFAGMLATMMPVFRLCFFTLLLLCVLDRPSRLRAVAAAFVTMACLMAVHALMQKHWGYGFAGQRPIYIAPRGLRPAHTRSLFFGIFEDPNDLAQILVTCIPLSFGLFRRRSMKGFLFGCGVSTLLLLAAFATRSRGGMVGLAAMGAVMAALILPARLLPFLIFVFAMGALGLSAFSGRFIDEAGGDRVVFWGEANWVFRRNMLFGMGHGMFTDHIEKSRAAHNAFVLCYTELGLFGYWFWYCLLQLSVIGAWRTRIVLRGVETETGEGEWLRRFSGLSLAAMAAFVSSAYFLSRAFVFPLFFLFAMLGVLPFLAKEHLPEDDAPLISWRRDVWVYGTIGALASVVYIYVSILILNMARAG